MPDNSSSMLIFYIEYSSQSNAQLFQCHQTGKPTFKINVLSNDNAIAKRYISFVPHCSGLLIENKPIRLPYNKETG